MRMQLRGALAASILGITGLAGCGGSGGGLPPVVGTPYGAVPVTEWAVPVGGTGLATGRASGAFPDGSTLVVGQHDQDVVFNRGAPDELALHGNGNACVFLARCDGEGRALWARCAQGTGYVCPLGGVVLAGGDVAVTGFFSGDAMFEDGLGGAAMAMAEGEESAFLLRYGSDGTLRWLRTFGAPAGFTESLGIAGLADGSTAVVGLFAGAMTLGAGEPAEASLVGDYCDAFVARHAADGTLLWARATRSAPGQYATGWAVAGTPDLGVVAGGELSGTTTFGTGESTETALTCGGYEDGWIARFGADGTLGWVRRLGGVDEQEIVSLAVAPDGSVRACGFFRGPSTVDADGPAPIELASSGGLDGFLLAFAADGTPMWANAVGAGSEDVAAAVAVVSDGSCLLTGTVRVEGDASGVEGPPTLHDRCYVARYDRQGMLLWVRDVGGSGDSNGTAVAVDEADGALLLTGRFTGRATFLDLSGLEPVAAIDASGDQDAFLARLSLDPTPAAAP